MNTKALGKLEKGWCNIDWNDWDMWHSLSPEQLDSIIDTIHVFKGNKSVKELAIAKIAGLPVYITVLKSDYNTILNAMHEHLIRHEMYESCLKVDTIKTYLNEQSRRNTKIMVNSVKA